MSATRLLCMITIGTLLAPGCGDDTGGGSDARDCVLNIDLHAEAPAESTGGPVTVHGTTAPRPGVTVHAVYVAGVLANRTQFNYRGFSVEVPEATVSSFEENGAAGLPVTAFISPYRCTAEGVEVDIVLRRGDGGAPAPDAGMPDATPSPDASGPDAASPPDAPAPDA
jgi:hypothetical protein